MCVDVRVARSAADTLVQTVYKAIQAGYRLFDGAGDYGNEKEAGEGLARAIKDGLVKREDVCKLTDATTFFASSQEPTV